MISEWLVLSCILALMVVVPIHLGLWLPLTDRRLNLPSAPGRMSRRDLRVVFAATVGLHGLWTLLTSLTLTPAVGSLLQLTLANVLLAPLLFTASFSAWLHWRILRESDRGPWLDVQPGALEADLPSVTVVISCRNEPVDVLLMTLRSAQQLRYPANKLSFLIADNSDEDHPDYLALCREVEARQIQGEPVKLLHRRGTRGFKAGNLDMALEASSGDLLLFLDVDNTVPEDFLLACAGGFWRDRDHSYLQLCKHVSNGHQGLVPATASATLAYSAFASLKISDYCGWSYFSGHACIWKRRDLLRVAPLVQVFQGKDLLAEDLYITFRGSRHGLQGHVQPIPSAFWAPFSLASLEAMIGRWAQGTLQCYIKDGGLILAHAMGYHDAGSYAALWYRIWSFQIAWLIPLLSLFLPFSWGGASLIAVLWWLSCWAFPLVVMALKSDPNVGGIRCGPRELLRMHLLSLFQAWSCLRGVLLFVFQSGSSWAQTPKLASGRAAGQSWLEVCLRFRAALLFSLVTPCFLVGAKGLLMGQPMLSPATFPILYLSAAVLLAIVIFAPSRPAPADYARRQRVLPAWMSCMPEVFPSMQD